jgi:circadian clock protein KaiB
MSARQLAPSRHGSLRRADRTVVPSFMSEYVFELYVAGDGVRSRRAIEILTTMCDERLPGRYGLTVIDVLEEPERAEHAKILATPTLLRRAPGPEVRIIGDLTLTRHVLAILDIPDDMARPERGRRDRA